MKKRAVLVHLNALVRVNPLVGGYLKAYAMTHPELRQRWDIDLYSAYYHTPASTIVRDILARRPQVLGFSVYSWNVGLVLRLLRTLRGLMPASTQFILGGVEVMHCAKRYLPPTWHNVVVCNGEGEQTFRDYLLEVTTGDLAMDRVSGLSFAADGAWHDTSPRPRIRKLDEIPSPYLTDMFSDEELAEVALFETNRGCPFACEFCYWGGAIGERVNKLEVERVKEEISYLARHHTKTVVVCDANFGMLKRDIELAEHIASLKRSCNAPQRLLYSTAKNNPDRVEQLARILTEAELLHNQSISLQTLNPQALKKASRDNIGRESYLRLQRRLNEWKVPSFVELLWPMPGETLESFKGGVDDLCTMGTQSFTIYPLLWLNNVGYADKTDEYGVVTLQEEDPVSGGQVVIQTREVSFDQYVDGLLYAMAVYLLHNCRGLYTTLSVLAALGVARPRSVFDAFVDFMNAGADAVVRTGATVADEAAGAERDSAPSASDTADTLIMWREGRDRFEQMISYVWRGALAYSALHSARGDFDKLLCDFVRAQWPRWTTTLDQEQQRLLRAAFEFDLLSRPFPYVQTPFEVEEPLTELQLRKRRRGEWTVLSAFDVPALLEAIRTGQDAAPHMQAQEVMITINHRPQQVYKLPAKDEEEHHWHMHQAIREIGNLEPAVTTQALHPQPA